MSSNNQQRFASIESTLAQQGSLLQAIAAQMGLIPAAPQYQAPVAPATPQAQVQLPPQDPKVMGYISQVQAGTVRFAVVTWVEAERDGSGSHTNIYLVCNSGALLSAPERQGLLTLLQRAGLSRSKVESKGHKARHYGVFDKASFYFLANVDDLPRLGITGQSLAAAVKQLLEQPQFTHQAIAAPQASIYQATQGLMAGMAAIPQVQQPQARPAAPAHAPKAAPAPVHTWVQAF